MLLGVLALSGGGHGWNSGALGCLFLAPVSFAACVNALGRKPSANVAIGLMVLGALVCVLVCVATLLEGTSYFFRLWHHVGVGGMLMWGIAYFNWALMSKLALWRVRTGGT